MTTFTKEQLIEIIKRNITVMDRYPDLVTAQMDLEVYKIALHHWKQNQLLIFSNIRPGNYSGL